jgi:hypothetical protein
MFVYNWEAYCPAFHPLHHTVSFSVESHEASFMDIKISSSCFSKQWIQFFLLFLLLLLILLLLLLLLLSKNVTMNGVISVFASSAREFRSHI